MCLRCNVTWDSHYGDYCFAKMHHTNRRAPARRSPARPSALSSPCTSSSWCRRSRLTRIEARRPALLCTMECDRVPRVCIERSARSLATILYYHAAHTHVTPHHAPFLAGVPGVTQCDVPYDGEHVYKFRLNSPRTLWRYSRPGLKLFSLSGGLVVRGSAASAKIFFN